MPSSPTVAISSPTTASTPRSRAAWSSRPCWATSRFPWSAPKPDMARVPYVEGDDRPDLADLTEQIRGARRGNLIRIYKLLLHSPALAESWFVHNNAVRWKTELDGRLRELVIIRVAQINGASYVEKQHVPELALAEGLTLAECEALSDWRNASSFSERERAALAYAESMTRDVAVPDAVFD